MPPIPASQGVQAVPAPTSKVSIKSIALPVQHGGWGFWMEPVLLGLLVAFSVQGLLLGIGGLMALLLHQPLRVALKDLRKGKRYARTDIALKFASLYGGILVIMALLIAFSASTWDFMLPLILAAGLTVIQLAYELKNEGREAVAEITGALIFSTLAPAIVLLGGGSLLAAAGLWAVQVARAVPSVIYVRARLRLEKGKPTPALASTTAHVIAVVALVGLVLMQMIPLLTLSGIIILTARAVWGLSARRRALVAKQVGFLEIAYGLINTVLAAIGYMLR